MAQFRNYWRYKYLTAMFIPGILYYIIFHYIPIYGVVLAFKEYSFATGILGSPWTGLENFRDLLSRPSFFEVFRNTLLISLYKLVFGFPAPILLALLLNELRSSLFKRWVQTISYLPHFLSWVILSGIIVQFLSPSIGPINLALKAMGFESIYFLADPAWFRTVLVSTDIWKDIGWGTIIYLAALTGINPDLYEAATVDGANRFKRCIYITIPSLYPVMTILLIFAVGKMANDDFDQVFNMYNPAVYKVGDVLSTYTYRAGLVNLEYSLATAVGLFKNVIAFILVISANWISRKVNDYGLW